MDLSMNYGNIEESELYDAQIHFYKHIHNIQSSMALKFAVELGIADAIHNHGKPMTLVELASTLKLNPSKVSILYRIMRLLTHNGFFAKTTSKAKAGEETMYSLTPPSKLLIRGKPMCLAFFAGGHPRYMNMWNYTKKWLLEEKEELSLFESANGETFWEMLNKDSESDNLCFFQEAMEADSHMFKLALKDCKHVFEGLETLVDVGGGTGVVAKLIHEVFPDIKYTVLDQPQVVGNLTGNENLNFVGGDMFKFIPHADAVLLKWILHDWNDELCLKILKNSKEAISGKGKDGKVIIIDMSIDETSDNRELTELQLNFDMVMLTLYNGKEREKKEWEKLIYDAGFSCYKITPIWGFKSLIEVYP
ncbi:isoflavone 4'-O-methyltransferase-like isoform X2 [Trifolium pratense]|uniref:Uncharacterized protein n=1 Tax=Trifolium pratense TaxID=57577 RepID=A0ACB0KH81_TRIPR|nr:isoflavone 4'-O-methyltransferase-like isoform X2 [Trifolium pratense]CAJ2655681.1 unnamed protein product [Trifolium pratense]